MFSFLSLNHDFLTVHYVDTLLRSVYALPLEVVRHAVLLSS